MSDYLETYGVGDEKRQRWTKRIILWSLAVIIAGTALFFTFRNWREERAVKQFLALLRDKNYQAAYAMWGCTAATPCPYYAFDKFMEDWGPKSPHADARTARIDDVDACGEGVVIRLAYPSTEPVPLWVARGNHVIGFAPWPECPGRHWRFKDFFHRLFGGS